MVALFNCASLQFAAVPKKKSPQNKKKPGRRSGPRTRPQLTDMQICDLLTTRSFFALSLAQRRQIQKHFGDNIDGWSFVPHPDVMALFEQEGKRLIRYIFFVETLRAKYYFATRDFLEKQTINVNSYFTGGSADFICDIHATDYRGFYDELTNLLVAAGAGILKDVKNLIAVFRVEQPLILSGQIISEMRKMDPRGLELLKADTARFEVAYRDYRSPEAKQLFGSDRAIRRYLAELEKFNIIIGYRALVDNHRLIDHEYIPLCHGRSLDNLLEGAGDGVRKILKPVLELLRVTPERATDDAEREVSHILINEYGSPGERNDWRRSTYEELGDDLNVFTFPLEGTLNETPIVFSDLPDAVRRAREYKGSIPIGRLSHASASTNAPPIHLQLESLGSQGLTLGGPNTGKTNTDCVLLAGLSSHMQRTIVIDHSNSIKEKEERFPEGVRKRFKYIPIEGKLSQKAIKTLVGQCVGESVHILAPSADLLPLVFDVCLNEIEKSTTNTGNRARIVDSLLLVEEANDALGKNGKRKQIVIHLEEVLTKAFRKGWCVWLSTQQPSHLGYDEASASRILRLLEWRIIHRIERADTSVIKRIFNGSPDARKVDDAIHLEKGEALVWGRYEVGNKLQSLPAVRVRINELGK